MKRTPNTRGRKAKEKKPFGEPNSCTKTGLTRKRSTPKTKKDDLLCPICDAYCLSKIGLEAHLQGRHPDLNLTTENVPPSEIYNCQFCEYYSTKIPRSLYEHLRKAHPIMQGDKMHEERAMLIQKLLNIMNESRKVSGRKSISASLGSQDSLNDELDIKPFICEHCNRCFESLLGLKIHSFHCLKNPKSPKNLKNNQVNNI